ncbi:hypothetical protein H0H93_009915, partial [Arthromyces matolae]
MSLRCTIQAGPLWCRSSERCYAPDQAPDGRTLKPPEILSLFLKSDKNKFPYRNPQQSTCTVAETTQNRNEAIENVPRAAIQDDPVPIASSPAFQATHFFQVPLVSNSQQYSARDANGMSLVPFDHLWGGSFPTMSAGSPGDFFFIISSQRHRILIKLDQWYEWLGLHSEAPLMIAHPNFPDMVAWIDPNEATWISIPKFTGRLAALQRSDGSA